MEYESICVLLPFIAYRKYYKRLKQSFTQFWAVMLITRSTIKRHHWRKVDNEKWLFLVLDCVSWQPYVVLNLWCHKTVTTASYPTSASHSFKVWSEIHPCSRKECLGSKSRFLFLMIFFKFIYLFFYHQEFLLVLFMHSSEWYFNTSYLVAGIYIRIKLFTSR